MKPISTCFLVKLLLVMVFAFAILPNCVQAQKEGDKIYLGELREIRSSILNEERAILVYTPIGYDRGQERYPVLYLLDGISHFHHVTGLVDFMTSNRLIPKMIVVAIANTDRMRDLTPTQDANRIFGDMPTAGGADHFLRFLEDEMIPYVDQNYRTHSYRILAGHSFGAMFGIYTLLTSPEVFNAYIAVSPICWWDDHFLARKAKFVFKDLPELQRFLYIAVGDEGNRMVNGVNRFVTILENRAPSGLEWEYHFMENEDHLSIPHRAIYDGLELLYKPWKIDMEFLNKDMAEIKRHCQWLSEKYGYKIEIEEDVLNAMGYQALSQEDYEKAIEIFKLNAKMHPRSANAFDSLGEGYEADGQLEAAIKSYETAVKKGRESNDPKLPIYRSHFENLKILLDG